MNISPNELMGIGLGWNAVCLDSSWLNPHLCKACLWTTRYMYYFEGGKKWSWYSSFAKDREGKWKQNVRPNFCQSLLALNLTRPALTTVGHPHFSPHSGQVYPRAQVPAPLLSSPAQVLRDHTYLSAARSIDWTGICFGERQEGDELIVGEVRPVVLVLIIRGSSSLFHSKITKSSSKEITRSLELHPGHRLWVIPRAFVGQDQG